MFILPPEGGNIKANFHGFIRTRLMEPGRRPAAQPPRNIVNPVLGAIRRNKKVF
jgi:hypothetical protein